MLIQIRCQKVVEEVSMTWIFDNFYKNIDYMISMIEKSPAAILNYNWISNKLISKEFRSELSQLIYDYDCKVRCAEVEVY